MARISVTGAAFAGFGVIGRHPGAVLTWGVVLLVLSVLPVLALVAIMGPQMLKATKSGVFDGEAWGAADKVAQTLTLEQATAAIASQGEFYSKEIGEMSDADFRTEIEMFGQKYTKGSFIVNLILGGFAAYRTQTFVYLKVCGREELSTMNLWAGMDAPPQ